MSKVISSVALTDFYNSAAEATIPCHTELFVPDEWTKIFAFGLQEIRLQGQIALEVGVGIGVNMAGLMTSQNVPAHFYGTDISTKAIEVSTTLARLLNINATLLRSNLLQDLDKQKLKQVGAVIACIPQVPADLDLSENDNSAHYYTPLGNCWDDYGLGLNAALIEQATEKSPFASITLNLCGRPGINKLIQMFEEFDRSSEIIHSAVIPQHTGTSLASLVHMEENGHLPFEFFKDPNGNHHITAAEAEKRRGVDEVYHKIYVIHSAPKLR